MFLGLKAWFTNKLAPPISASEHVVEKTPIRPPPPQEHLIDDVPNKMKTMTTLFGVGVQIGESRGQGWQCHYYPGTMMHSFSKVSLKDDTAHTYQKNEFSGAMVCTRVHKDATYEMCIIHQ